MHNLGQDAHKWHDYQTLFAEHGMDRSQSKMLPRTVGHTCTGHTLVTIDQVCGNPVSLGQILNKLSQGPHLRIRRDTLIKIPHQADPHGVFVGPVAWGFAVRPGDLLMPPEGDLHQPIWAVCAIAYHKIIPHTVPIVALSVPFVKDGHIAIGRG